MLKIVNADIIGMKAYRFTDKGGRVVEGTSYYCEYLAPDADFCGTKCGRFSGPTGKYQVGDSVRVLEVSGKLQVINE